MIHSSNLYKQVDQWLSATAKPRQMVHFRRAAYWVKQLRSDADEAMLIAALGHDAERVFHGHTDPKAGENLHEPAYLKKHQEGGADIVGDFLQKSGADQKLVDRVRMLIARHEEGGTDDQNVIKDADSVSFFENNIDHFLNDLLKKCGRENVKDKFQWMFSRITSERAKDIVKSWYEQAMESLKKY
ncbi:MAG: HD domain-containing protein [Patescibacteria group bacterium]|jgi:hypothetical protein